jgi:hypothetical protein
VHSILVNTQSPLRESVTNIVVLIVMFRELFVYDQTKYISLNAF